MALTDSSTPTCPSTMEGAQHHLTLGEACLEVTSTEPHNTLQLWAQAVECYKCPPWPYLTLPPNSTANLVVNTTYPTNIFITNTNGSDLHSLTYHFGEYGNYQMGVGVENASTIKVSRLPERELLPLFTAAMFFLLVTLVWQFAKFIVRRMDEPTSSQPRPRTVQAVGELSPLLSNPEEALVPSLPQAASTSTQSLAASTSTQSPVASTSTQSLAASTSIQSPVASTSSQPLQPSEDPQPPEDQPPPNTYVPLSSPDPNQAGGRLLSLDTFRGLAIVIMIFVNYGGGKYYFFAHARWNGLTVADLVFPWFLWIMGTSLVFSVRSQLRRTTKRYLIILKILKRCLLLFTLGIVVNSTNGHNYMPMFRALGVLQRFAIVYLLTAVIEVYVMNPQESPEYVRFWKVRDIWRSAPQWLYTIILVAIHLGLTFGLSVPGCPKGYLGPGGLHEGGKYGECTGGAAGYIDRVVLGRNHVYQHPTCTIIYNSDTPYDPEGLLGALTSVLVVQLGAACGRIIITYRSHNGRIVRWIIWGLVTGLLAGLLCGWRKEDGLIPINKNLWSLSFVLCTASFAFLLFTFLYFIIDKRKWWSGNPLRYAGMNSILLYVGHEVCGGLLPWSWKPVGQYHGNFLLMNLWATSLWIFIAYLCHRRKLYLSV